MTDLAVPLHSRRRARALLFQKVQHALPSVLLLLDGAKAFGRGVDGGALVLAAAEVLSGALVMASIARAFQELSRSTETDTHREHSRVDWVDLFLAAMLATEGWAHFEETRHLQRPTVLLAILMLGLGLMHGPMQDFTTNHRTLRLTAEGLTVGGRFFTRFTARWDEVERVDIDDRTARIVIRDGRERRFDLADLQNARDVRLAPEAARERIVGAPPTPLLRTSTP